MSECLVGIGHLVDIFALLHGCAGVVGGVQDLSSQPFLHGVFAALAAVDERSLLSILTEYSRNAGPELKHELDITIADMNSGNQEAAITRLEARVGSSMMSDVCRGFIGMIRGDSAPIYWSNLAMKFSDIHRQRLRLEAQKIPRKVKKLSMSLLFCFMLIYVVVIIAQIMGSVGVLFG